MADFADEICKPPARHCRSQARFGNRKAAVIVISETCRTIELSFLIAVTEARH